MTLEEVQSVFEQGFDFGEMIETQKGRDRRLSAANV